MELNAKQVQTKRGLRWVTNFPANEQFWGIWKSKRPGFCTVNKNAKDGRWWVSVWAETMDELLANLEEIHPPSGRKTTMTIPFGRYKGWAVSDIPGDYIAWLLSGDGPGVREEQLRDALEKQMEAEGWGICFECDSPMEIAEGCRDCGGG